jgi:hypothetical protein
VRFLIHKTTNLPKLSLVYREEDYSFDVEPLSTQGYTSILINDLHLEITYEGKIIYVWGLCPLINYLRTDKTPNNYTAGEVTVILDNPTPGISKRLNDDKRWPIYINKNKGWVCIGDPHLSAEMSIEFIPNCIAELDNHQLKALWLKPNVLPDL